MIIDLTDQSQYPSNNVDGKSIEKSLAKSVELLKQGNSLEVPHKLKALFELGMQKYMIDNNIYLEIEAKPQSKSTIYKLKDNAKDG